MKKLLVVAALLMPFGASIAAPVSAVPGAPTNYRYFDRLPSASGSIRPPGTDESIPLGSSGCGSRTVSWTVGGNTCTGSTGTTSGNTVKAVTSTNANSGIGNFRCDGTTFDYTYQAAGSTCAPPPPANCTAQTLSWTIAGNTCTGAASTTANSATVSVASTSANSGTGSFTCNSATNTYTNNAASSTCNPVPPASCTDKPLNWTVGGVTCGAQSGVTANATNKTISSTNGQNGSATFTCNSSTDTYTQGAGATCSAPACSSQSLNWTVGGLTCSGTAASTANTGSATVNNTTAGRTGSATFTCNGSTNAYTGPAPGASCAAAATACTDKTVSWTQGSNTCSAPSGTTNNGTTKTVTTTTASRLGSASITCNASTDTYTVAAGGTCYPTTCTSQTLNWTSGSNTCSGTTGTVNNGASASVTSTSANTGSVTATCNSQTNTYAQSGATCNAPPANCAAQTVSWTAGLTCSGPASATSHSATRSVSSTSGNTGSATFTCNNGTFTNPTGASCSAPPPVNCASQTLNWTAGGNTCSAVSGARNTSTTFTLASTNGLSGSASFTCTNGTYSAPSSATCSAANFASVGVDKVSAGTATTCGVTSMGAGWCWGQNTSMTGGNPSVANNAAMPNPVSIAGNITWRQIQVSGGRACGTSTANVAYCWGYNSLSSPAARASGYSVQFTSVGNEWTSALLTDGRVIHWGNNSRGQFGNNSTTGNSNPVVMPGTDRWQFISAGNLHVCGLTLDGTAKCWGFNASGQLGDGTVTDRLVPTPISDTAKYKYIVTGRDIQGRTTCGITTDGIAKCWGRNVTGALGDGTKTDRSVPTVVSGGHRWLKITITDNGGCGITTTNDAYCWGDAAAPFLYSGSRIGDGTLSSYTTPQLVVGGFKWKEISGAVGHTCGTRTDGVVMCWGSNEKGILGNGEETINANSQYRNTKQPIAPLTNSSLRF